MGGESIFRVRADDPNRNVIVETMAQRGARSVMAQRYIPEIARRRQARAADRRQAGAALPRAHPEAGRDRAATSPPARAAWRSRSRARDREIAARARARCSQARGLLLVGLDVIGDYLTEVNVTSPTCFREIQDQTGFDVAGMFMDALEKRRLQHDRHPDRHARRDRRGAARTRASHDARRRRRSVRHARRHGARTTRTTCRARARAAATASTTATACWCSPTSSARRPATSRSRCSRTAASRASPGVNLPMLLRALTYRDGSLAAAVREGALGRRGGRGAHEHRPLLQWPKRCERRDRQQARAARARLGQAHAGRERLPVRDLARRATAAASNAKSIMGVMMLAAGKGSSMTDRGRGRRRRRGARRAAETDRGQVRRGRR